VLSNLTKKGSKEEITKEGQHATWERGRAHMARARGPERLAFLAEGCLVGVKQKRNNTEGNAETGQERARIKDGEVKKKNLGCRSQDLTAAWLKGKATYEYSEAEGRSCPHREWRKRTSSEILKKTLDP